MSCSKENTIINNNSPLSFTAGFAEGTKSMLNDDRSQTWLGGDQVIIYDVTDKSTPSSQAKFTNISSNPSTSATFTINPEFSSFEFVTNHKYLALHNATGVFSDSKSYRIIMKNSGAITYDSGRKYGMPDHTIPVAYYFTYSGKSSLQNFSFKNIMALCVVRVTNNTSAPINISKIELKASSDSPDSKWNANVFGGIWIVDYSSSPYVGCSASPLKDTNVITCNNTIEPGATCDYSTLIARIYYTSRGTISVTIDVKDGSETLATATKTIQENGQPRGYDVGDTKVFNISVNPS